MLCCKKSLILFCLIFLSLQFTFAQEKNPTQWPYGGMPDESRKDEFWMVKPPLNFHRKADFGGVTFSQSAYFREAKFDSIADFGGATFSQFTDFQEAAFSQFADFREAKFDSIANFVGPTFSQKADFSWAAFSRDASFSFATFIQDVYFHGATFAQDANFNQATFSKETNFTRATFKEIPIMDQCRFGKILRLGSINFEKGVDFRRAIFDSVETIYVSHQTTFPEGKLHLYWDQFKGTENLRIRLVERSILNLYDEKEHYQRIETLYHRLRDNFLAQGNKVSADAVMYELGWQKKEIYAYWSWVVIKQTMYGWFFGWGYQPWRFLVFVVVPIIIAFAILWQKRYFSAFEKVIFKDVLSDANALSEQGKSVLQRSMQSLYFSASVLLGIRLKKNWLIKHNNFLVWVCVEWTLGIGLYIMFALLVKGSRFDVIKGLLGF